MSNCFLIADEVGLGKTRTARAIAYEMARIDGHARIFYLASNNYIATENINDFNGENREISHKHSDNFAPLVPYQCATAIRALEAFGYHDVATTQSKNTAGRQWQKSEQQSVRGARLSMLSKESLQSPYAVFSLTPITSFNTNDTDIFGNGYVGSDAENTAMNALFSKDWAETEIALQVAVQFEYAMYYRSQHAKEAKNTTYTTCKEFYSWLQTPIGKSENTASQNDATRRFRARRNIVSNYQVLQVKPTLIILDEFQKYRTSVDCIGEGKYSVTYLCEFLRCLKAELANASNSTIKESLSQYDKELLPYLEKGVKILLLSATPYQYHHATVQPCLQKDGESDETAPNTAENPFENFGALKHAMKKLGADTTSVERYMSRTERKLFFSEEDRKIYSDYSIETYDTPAHIQYLAQVLKTAPQLAGYCNRYLATTPHFWNFTKGYQCEEELAALCAQTIAQLNAIDAAKHVALQNLIEQCLPQGIENRLWIAPSKQYHQADATAVDRCGKTVVFTSLHMTARAVAYYVDTIIEERLSKNMPNGARVCGNSITAEDWTKNGKEIPQSIQRVLPLLNTDRAKRVITHCYGAYTVDTIETYCRAYQLDEVLREYDYVLERSADCIDEIAKQEFGQVDVQGKSHSYLFAARYTNDAADKEGHDPLFAVKLQQAFNAPFYPFVLVATNTAQEGINLHKYADKLMHFTTATDANAFQQREGRVDRPNSITMRRRLVELFQGESDFATCTFESMKTNVMAQLEQRVTEQSEKEKLHHASSAGILPMWYLPKLSDSSAQIKRVLAPTALSGDKADALKIHEAAKKYSDFLTGKQEHEKMCAFCAPKRQ